MAAKKIEVFASEYEYLKRTAQENALALTVLTAERDNLRKDYGDLMREFASVCYEHDCKNCKHASDPKVQEFCKAADCECETCTAPCPCRACDQGSNFKWDRKEKEN